MKTAMKQQDQPLSIRTGSSSDGAAKPRDGWNGRLARCFRRLAGNSRAASHDSEARPQCEHHGADVRSLARSAWGVVSRQRLGGGSTLTMQYARLRWHLDTRSVWGKLTQVFRALQLERHYGKTAVAEAYFTFAPYGGNVEGVE